MLARRMMQQPPGQMSLNITSLMDILTIILIFLIISFSSEEAEITAPDDFALPASSSQRPVKLAVKVSVSAEALRVEDQPVVTLVQGRFRAADLDAAARVVPLLEELRRHKARLMAGAAPAVAPADDGEDEAEILYLEAAKGMRYDTIDRVLETAAAAGFVRFRLAVQRRS